MIAIAAMSPERVIGAGGKIPWHISEDLKFFKRTTLGHVVVMGRKTFESLGKPLPGRENWVVSRAASFQGVRMFRDPAEIIAPDDGREVFVIGGAELYRSLLPACSEILLTHVALRVEGDTWLPVFEKEFDAGEVVQSGAGHEIRRYRRLTVQNFLASADHPRQLASTNIFPFSCAEQRFSPGSHGSPISI
ncbi:MAG: dihydrofolate reductase [Verrucomicrobiae bacterium]